MARLLRMPEVAANAAEAVLQDWSLEDSSAFSAEEVLATVETEKAVVDVEAEEAGVLLRRLVAAGSQVEVGAPIALLGDPDERVDDIDALLADLGVTPGAAPVAPERRLVPDDPEGGTANTATHVAQNGHPAPATVDREGRHGRTFASPLARRLAREAGLPVEEITGTGPGGRIVRRDVEAALADRPETRGTPPAAPRPSGRSAREQGAASFTDVPHSRMRRAIASRLVESKQSVPHFYLRGTVRVDRLLELRAELNAMGTQKISLNDLVIKAAARAHVLVPQMNVIWTDDAVRMFSSVDMSVAVATERGLVTPVLRGIESMSISAVGAAVSELVACARSGTLRQEELEGGTFSVTNLGMFGTEEFAAIINPPQAAILAVGAARSEPVVTNGELGVGTVMRVTLSVDHRAVDGALAAQWMAAFVSVVESPVRILA
jgi:pyruvate dehydrogenase E2 component (dihydrolipoamide acetyltransferase)